MKKTITLFSISLSLIMISCAKGIQSSDLAATEKQVPEKTAEDYRTPYVGEYETRPNENIRIFIDGPDLKIEGPGQPIMLLVPTEQKNKFFLKEFDVHIQFEGENGQTEKLLMIRWDGQTLESPKIK